VGECALNGVSSKTIADFAQNVSPAVCGSSFRLRNSSRSGSSHRNGESADCSGTSSSAEIDTRGAPPGPSGTKILLAQASTPEQSRRARNQTEGRVFLFLHTDRFWRDHNALTPRGKKFVKAPKEEQYGTAAVFENLYGNKWDLLQLNAKSRQLNRHHPHFLLHLAQIDHYDRVPRSERINLNNVVTGHRSTKSR
jgi:hypothetical protein